MSTAEQQQVVRVVNEEALDERMSDVLWQQQRLERERVRPLLQRARARVSDVTLAPRRRRCRDDSIALRDVSAGTGQRRRIVSRAQSDARSAEATAAGSVATEIRSALTHLAMPEEMLAPRQSHDADQRFVRELPMSLVRHTETQRAALPACLYSDLFTS